MPFKRKYKPMGLNDFFRFGKHKGESLRNVLVNDAQYVVWCINTIDTFGIIEAYQEILLEQYGEWVSEHGASKPFKTCDLTKLNTMGKITCCPIKY